MALTSGAAEPCSESRKQTNSLEHLQPIPVTEFNKEQQQILKIQHLPDF